MKQLDKGVVGTCAYALQEVALPDIKNVRSMLTGYELRIGDFDVRPKQAVELNVKTSKCTSLLRPPTMKKFAHNIPLEGEVKEIDDDTQLFKQLHMATDYLVDPDEDVKQTQDTQSQTQAQTQTQTLSHTDTQTQLSGEPENAGNQSFSGQRVEKEELVRGYKYGSTFVPCEDDYFQKLPTRKGIDVLGFFPLKSVRLLWQSLLHAITNHCSLNVTSSWQKSSMSGLIRQWRPNKLLSRPL